jgi:MFS family permease
VKLWALALLFLLGLALALGVSAFQNSPGYMDADYYMAGGQRLADGYGFQEMLLWNYLDDPQGIPHPSHAYWMPLASIIAMGGMLLSGLHNYYGGRLAFIFLAGLLPPATYLLASDMIPDRMGESTGRFHWLAALLAVFSGFYLPFMATSDTFAISMLLGVAFFGIVNRLWVSNDKSKAHWQGLIWWMLLGAIAGFLHLARVDGILWVGLAGLSAVWPGWPNLRQVRLHPDWLKRLACVLVGYFVIMGPWILRNLAQFGVPFSPGGGRMLWITNYNELYIYPATMLTFQRWLQQGLGAILQARLSALGQNLATLFAVQGGIFLLPLMLLGLRRSWRMPVVRLGLFAYGLIFTLMTLVFPYAGARGGLLHSGAVLQPLLWVLAAVGLDVFLSWGVAHRNWVLHQAGVVFASGLVLLAILVSGVVFYKRMFNPQPPQQPWDAAARLYSQVNDALLQMGADGGEIVMVNNPPAYYLVSGRPAVSIPFGDLNTVLSVAKRYHARFLALEFNQLTGSDDLFVDPGDRPGLHYLRTVDSVRIYEFEATQ